MKDLKLLTSDAVYFFRSLGLLFILLSNILLVPAQAQTAAINVDDAFTERSIGLNLALFEDKSAQLTLQDIQSPQYTRQFIPSTKQTPSFGYTPSAYWARFALNDTRNPKRSLADAPLMLTLSYAQTDLAELWCADHQGAIVQQQRAGDHVPLAEWPTTYRTPAFEVPSAAQTCWLRVQSSASLQFPLALSTHAAFADQRVKDSTIQALYFGALLVMFIYNGLLAATTRSRANAPNLSAPW